MVCPHERETIPVEHEADVDEKNSVTCAAKQKSLFQKFAQPAPERPLVESSVLREVLAQFNFVMAGMLAHFVIDQFKNLHP